MNDPPKMGQCSILLKIAGLLIIIPAKRSLTKKSREHIRNVLYLKTALTTKRGKTKAIDEEKVICQVSGKFTFEEYDDFDVCSVMIIIIKIQKLKGEKMQNNEEKFDAVKYRNGFNKDKYDRVNIMLPKGQKGGF